MSRDNSRTARADIMAIQFSTTAKNASAEHFNNSRLKQGREERDASRSDPN